MLRTAVAADCLFEEPLADELLHKEDVEVKVVHVLGSPPC